MQIDYWLWPNLKGAGEQSVYIVFRRVKGTTEELCVGGVKEEGGAGGYLFPSEVKTVGSNSFGKISSE